MLYNLTHLLLGVYKPVACDDEAWVYADILEMLVEIKGFQEQILVDLKTRRKTLHLSVDTFAHRFTAIDIVIGKLAAHHHILHIDVVTITTGTA